MRLIRTAAATLVALGLVAVVAAPAAAHDVVVATTPAEGEVVTVAPDEFRLTSSDALLYVDNDAVFGLWARDAAGDFYGDGCVVVEGASMSAPAVLGEPGTYTLVAAFISSDGHPTTAEIPFEWTPDGDFEAATGTAEPTRCGEPAAAEAPAAGTPVDSTLIWVLIAAAAVAIAIGATVLIARPRRMGDEKS